MLQPFLTAAAAAARADASMDIHHCQRDPCYWAVVYTVPFNLFVSASQVGLFFFFFSFSVFFSISFPSLFLTSKSQRNVTDDHIEH